MNWLLHNPLADLRGPDFLAVYAVVIFATLLGLNLYLRGLDTTRSLKAPPVPPTVDPRETAFLRDGRNGLAQLLVLSLLDRGYLDATLPNNTVQPAENHPDPRHLAPVEKEIFDHFATPQPGWQAPRLAASGPLFERVAKAYEEKLRGEKLLRDPATNASVGLAGLAAVALILGLGGYKLFVAFSRNHHNVGFLIAMAFVAFPLVVLTLVRANRPLSACGRAYLAKLELAFAKLRARASLETTRNLDGDSLLLLTAIFGIPALAKTPWQQRATALTPPPNVSSSSCSSGSGCSSSSGGSSCGGGGGGCGGCGGGGD